jgi:hypothetical protein
MSRNSKSAMGLLIPKIALPFAGLLTGGLIVAAFGFSLAVNLPGHLTYDSVIQLYEGRFGAYAGWHPPIMSWLLGLGDALDPGTALFVIFDTLLLYGAMALLVLIRKRPSWLAAPVVVLMAATPQFLIYPGTVWKDVLFVHAAIAGFACLAYAAAQWPKPRRRFALIAASLAFFVLAALARQNGILVLLAGVGGLGWIAASQAADRRRRQALVYGGCALAAALIAIVAGTAALDLRKTGDSGPWAQFRLLELYDIVGMTKADPGIDLHQLDDHLPGLAAAVRSDGVRLYTPLRNDDLLNSAKLLDALASASPSTVFRQWRDLVIRHPWLYLKIRGRVFWQVFATPDISLCLPYAVGVAGPARPMRALHLAERDDDRDDALDDYASRLQGTPVFSHPFFFATGIVCLLVLLRRRRAADLAMAAMLAGFFAFTASFFVISIACDYRYLYGIDMAAMIALFYLTLDPRALWQASPHG